MPEILDCPKCGSIMAVTQTLQGAVFICGHCHYEIPIDNDNYQGDHHGSDTYPD